MRSTIVTRIALAVRPNSAGLLGETAAAGTVADSVDTGIVFRRTEVEGLD
jgi:hypothetical protein